jgi:hypothetical protein
MYQDLARHASLLSTALRVPALCYKLSKAYLEVLEGGASLVFEGKAVLALLTDIKLLYRCFPESNTLKGKIKLKKKLLQH